MKKSTLLIGIIGTFLICLIIIFRSFTQSTPTMKTIKGPVLIDRLEEENFKIDLFYSDLALAQIKPYEVTGSTIKAVNTHYTSYTEGIIESNKNALLLKAVNRYRAFEGLEPITYYHNYIELDGYGFLSLTDGLTTLYIIDLSTYEVTCPSFDSSYALDSQYIYHITEGEDAYYILSAEANGYKAYWYALSKDHFDILASKKLSPPTKAVESHHYALDSNGNAYFVGNNSLLIITPEEAINLPLDFNPEIVYYANNQIYILKTSELFLNYAIYNLDIGVTQTGQVNLPNKFVSLISYDIHGSILYTITHDKDHPIYRNYITLYNLETNNIIYCLALKSAENGYLSLVGAHYQ